MSDLDESASPSTGRPRCGCTATVHTPRLIVLTGGPGAGKTAVLEVVRRTFCEHVAVLPEAATILFGGGFPRSDAAVGRRAGQRAIFRVQRELERMALEQAVASVVLCDRGTMDGLAYWPAGPDALLSSVGSTPAAELARYEAIIHLRTPSTANGFDHSNPMRTESAAEAATIDEAIARAWSDHPRRFVIDAAPDFMVKVAQVIALVRAEVAPCCRAERPRPAGLTATPSDRAPLVEAQ